MCTYADTMHITPTHYLLWTGATAVPQLYMRQHVSERYPVTRMHTHTNTHIHTHISIHITPIARNLMLFVDRHTTHIDRTKATAIDTGTGAGTGKGAGTGTCTGTGTETNT